MTLGAHSGASVKIHTSRSMASTINTSHSESLFRSRRCKISDILTVGDSTLAVGGGTVMVDCGTLTAGDGTLAVSGGTLTAGIGLLAVGGSTLAVNNNTLIVSGGNLMSDGQHRLNGAIASMTR
jgi:hypothetical protein